MLRRLPSSLSSEAIRTVWKHSRDANPSTAGASGIDWIRAAAFSAHLAENIAEMRDDIRKDNYRFKNLRIAPIEKPSGGYRIIAIPTVRDRLLQRALLQHLEADHRFSVRSAISYGFTKSRTLADAQLQALNLRDMHPWVLQADIVQFFDRIPRQNVKRLIKKHVRSTIVGELLSAAVDCELDARDKVAAALALDNGVIKGVGLRQGMPVSPLLSNLLLKDFDNALVKRGINAIRYADDIAVFADSRNACRDALKFVRDTLAKLHLNVPDLAEDSKTKLREPSESVEFLGVEIKRAENGYVLAAPSKKLAKIDGELAKIASVESCIENRRNLGQVVQTLDSFVIGHAASMAVLKQPNDFLSRLEASKQRCIEDLLTNILGKEAVKKLDKEKRAILGLTSFPTEKKKLGSTATKKRVRPSS